MQIFGAFDGDGACRASDLFEREEFIIEYERRSGRTVNRRTLHYYDVMSSWKCNVIVAANGLDAARSQHNHQDVLLTFLAAAAPMFANDLVRLLSKGAPARSEEHTSELQSLMRISYAVFLVKKKTETHILTTYLLKI